MDKRILFIINPYSGRNRSKKNILKVLEIFCSADYEVTVKTTKAKDHATQIVIDNADRFDMIVCCGGDGTLNEVINGVMQLDEKKLIGYIPAGTTNDFASSLGLPKDLVSAAQTVIDGEPYKIDIGSFNNRYFIYTASFGAFTECSYSVPQSMKKVLGHFAYVMESVKDIQNLNRIHMKVKADDLFLEDDYIFGTVSNSISLGGVMKLNSDLVSYDDGFYELLLIKYPKSYIELQKIVSAILTNNFISDENIVFRHCKEIVFYSNEEVAWTLDGEYEKGSNEIRIFNNHRAVTIMKSKSKELIVSDKKE